VVELARQAGSLGIAAQRCTHPLHLVGRDGGTRAAPAEQHRGIGNAICHRAHGGITYRHPLAIVTVRKRTHQRDVVIPACEPLDDRIGHGLP
jgi:hypothetical protein